MTIHLNCRNRFRIDFVRKTIVLQCYITVFQFSNHDSQNDAPIVMVG